MRLILNFFTYLFIASIFNTWVENVIINPDLLWATASEIVSGEKETEVNQSIRLIKSISKKVKAAGGDSKEKLKDFDNIANKIYTVSLIAPFSCIKKTCSSIFRQYYKYLLDSLKIHKLFILFHCIKADIS